jgi:hypothetical protein
MRSFSTYGRSAVLEPLRRVAVKSIKPRVSKETWQALRSLQPSSRKKVKRRAQDSSRANGSSATAAAANSAVPPPERDLVSLARQFGTDKWGIHRYAPHYERHFAKFKNETFSLLEIGIGGYSKAGQGGASLRMWKAFFPKAQIIGLDIADKSFVEEDRIQAFQGSQTSEPLLRTIVDSAHDLQIVVDDGSHRPEHIRQTFSILFPLLPDGALYAIEDTQTSYWPRWGGSRDLDEKSTTMGLVKGLIDGLNYEEWQDENDEPSYTDLTVVAVHCYHNLVIIEKGSNREGTNRGPRWKDEP